MPATPEGYEQTRGRLLQLGYTDTFPEPALPLVQTLLSDLQAAVTKLKSLNSENERVMREDRTLRTENQIHKAKLRNLQQDNNSLRAEVLQATRQAEQSKRETGVKLRQMEAKIAEYQLQVIQLNSEKNKALNRCDEERRRIDVKLREIYRGQGGRVVAKVSSELGERLLEPTVMPRPESYVVNLIDLNERRIMALEKEIDLLEQKNQDISDQLESAQYQIEARDLEIQRLNVEVNNLREARTRPSVRHGSEREQRLEDQIDYLQEYNTSLEEKLRQQEAGFEAQKSELKWQVTAIKQQNLELAQQLRDTEQRLKKQTETLEQVRNLSTPVPSAIDLVRSPKSLGDKRASQSESPKFGPKRDQPPDQPRADILIDHAKHLLKELEAKHATSLPGQQTKDRKKTIERLRSTLEQIGKILLEVHKTADVDANAPPATAPAKQGNSAPALSPMSDSYLENKTFIEPRSDWSSHLQELQKDYRALRAERDTLKSLYEQTVQQLRRERTHGPPKLRQTIAQLKDELASLKGSLGTPQGEQLAQLQAELDEAKHELEKKMAQIQELEAKANDSATQRRRRHDEMDLELKAARDKCGELSATLDEHRARYHKLQAQYNDLKAEHAQCQSKIMDGGSRYQQLMDSYQQLTTEHDKLDKALKQALVDVYALEARAKDRQARADTLEKELEGYRVSCQGHTQELESYRHELRGLEAEIKTMVKYREQDKEEQQQLAKQLAEERDLRRATELSKDEYKRLLSNALSDAEATRKLISQIRVEKDSLM
ncbi:hypothetical protein EV182_002816, partial [Spiromyces aspiralis]